MPDNILLSRTDSIGDMVLTLPMAGVLKAMLPGCRVMVLGRAYTRPVVDLCPDVDAFFDWDGAAGRGVLGQTDFLRETGATAVVHVFPVKEIALAAMKTGIPLRIGTTGRLWHYRSCNRLVRLSRRNSALHEAQLNLALLRPFGIRQAFSLGEVASFLRLSPPPPPDGRILALLRPDRFNLILHPKSKGSAREWGLDNFTALAALLPPERYNILVTGTKEEGLEIRGSGIFGRSHVYDLTGRFSLEEFIRFIGAADGMVAASTGPLHLAAALGKRAVGLYPPIRPMHPGRWAPLGTDVHILVKDKTCQDCRYGAPCHCMTEITPEEVAKCLAPSPH